MVRFAVLGPVLTHDEHGRRIELRGRTQRCLLGLLLSRPGEVISRERLAEAVGAGSAGAVHSAVSRLRGALGPGGAEVIRTEGSGYLAEVSPERLDALRFERLLAAARRAEREGGPARAAEALRLLTEAEALWHGDSAYQDLADLLPLGPVTARLDELRLVAAEDRAELLRALGRPAEAASLLEAHHLAHPLRERPIGLLMRVWYGLGQQTRALELFRRHRLRLAEELGIDPAPELCALETAILRHDLPPAPAPTPTPEPEPVAAPPPAVPVGMDMGAGMGAGMGIGAAVSAAVSAPVTTPVSAPVTTPPAPPGPAPGLPVPPTSLIGRDEQLDRLTELLDAHPLVSLVGTGGVGKTRLAAHAARLVGHRFPDGVIECRLADLDGPAALFQELSVALGLLPESERRLADLVPAALCLRKSLLVLDNCEHLIEPVAELAARLVQQAEHLRILVTSREPLAVEGEQVFPVEPLGGPDAVALFLDRARAADPHFGPGPGTGERTAVAELCRRLDGLPLAIELAAVRSRALSPAGILRLLDDGLAVLSGRRRHPEGPRHRSLTSVVDWSFRLLTGPERTLFTQLAVFPGSFTLDAVAGVTCARPHLLADLVEQSLVRRSGARYSLLETLRQYGRERLAERDGQLDALRARHAAWYTAHAEALVTSAPPPDEHWVTALERELPHFRAAQQWYAESGDLDGLLRLLRALHYFGCMTLRPEILAWARTALRIAGWPGGDGDGDGGEGEGRGHPLLGSAMGTAALAAWFEGDIEEARRLARAGAAYAERHGDPGGRYAHDVLGDIAWAEERSAEALHHYRRVRQLAAEAGEAHGVRFSDGCVAFALLATGDEEQARRLSDTVAPPAAEPDPGSLDAQIVAELVRAEIALRGDADRDGELPEEFLHAARLGQRTSSTMLTMSAWVALATAQSEYDGSGTRAARTYRSLLADWPSQGAELALAIALRGVLDLLVRHGVDEPAAVLCGALPPAPASILFTGVSARAEAVAGMLRARLGQGRFRELCDRGRHLTRTAVLSHATAALDRLTG
ncbi:BTAD domain-containing putative transcriptional regulator [Streptomyces sp. YIM 98790]|uniref:AfsR/SARP family transcriptional regulator n=1 Tax=Streptomyces sp. YIM 98790 TaxID=2689077 RepID=UPI00140CA80D|nr:BTAD domain-containing putative transcriptional regulator [Streptomyces sp. YIM 98790]